MSDCSNSVNKYIIVQPTAGETGVFSGLTICGGLGLTVDFITGCTSDGVNVEGATFQGNTLTIPTIYATSFSGVTFSGGTFYGDGSNLTGISTIDSYMTGGTYSNGFITFSGSGNFSDVIIDVSGLLDNTDNYVTGGTYSNGTLYFSGTSNNQTFQIDVSDLLDDTNTYVTGGTLVNGNTLNLNYNNGGSASPIDLSQIKFTGNTSGDCITDLHVSNIHACSPLNINPLDEGNVYFGSTSGVTIEVVDGRIITNYFRILNPPTLNPSLSQLLGRNVSTGNVEYINTSSFVYKSDFDTYSGSVQTQIDSKLNVTDFNSYSAYTNSTLTAHTTDTNNPHQTSLANLFGGSGHTHTLSEITDFSSYSGSVQTQIDSKLNISNFNTYSGNVQTQLDTKLVKSEFDSYSSTTQTTIDSKISFNDAENRYVNVTGDTMTGTLILPAGTTTDPSLILSDGGTLLNSPQIGAFEFLGTSLYFTDFTGSRRNVLLAQSGFTATTVNALQDTEVGTVTNGQTWYYDGDTNFWRNTGILTIDDTNNKVDINSTLNVGGVFGITGTTTELNTSLNVYNGHVNLNDNSYFLQGTSTGDSNVSLIGVDNQDRVYIGNQGYLNYIADDTTINGDLHISGDLTVAGSATTVNIISEEVLIADNFITLNSNVTGGTPTENAGIEISRGNETKSRVVWNETTDLWEMGISGSTKRVILEGDSLSLLTSGHTHPISEINGLQTQLDSKLDISNFNVYSGSVQTQIDSKLGKTEFNSYSGNVQTQLDSKLNKSEFDTYSGSVQTQLNNKVETASNLSGGIGLFSGKTGTDLQFKSLNSSGGTVVITQDGNTVNLEVTHTVNTNDYVTGGTLNGNILVLNRTDQLSGATIDLSSLDTTDNYTTGSTINGNTLIFNRTDALSAYTVDLTGLSNLPTDQEFQLFGNQSSTGIIYTDGLSVNGGDNTKFDLGLTQGWIVDNTTNPTNPTTTFVNFSASTLITPTYLATFPVTYIGLTGNTVSDIVQSSSPFSSSHRRDILEVGAVIHSDNTIINVVNNLPTIGIDPTAQLYDLIDGIGYFNLRDKGNVYSPYTGLTISKNGGDIFAHGSNYENDPKNPHVKTLSSGNTLTFRYRLQDSTEFGNTTEINPGIYDTGSGTGATPSNKYTIQRIYVFPSGISRLQYGQTLYDSLSNAQASIPSETFNVEQNMSENGILRGFIVLRGDATDLTDTTQARFITANHWGDANDTVPGDAHKVEIENSLSTGVRSGGEITVNGGDNTKFDISGGSGIIVDNFTNPDNPSQQQVRWGSITGITSTYLTASTFTYISLDNNGNVIQTEGNTGLTPEQKRNEILLGGILHIGGQILFSWDRQIPITSPMNHVEDLTTSIGPFAISGNRISKITGTLELQKSVGESFYFGGFQVGTPKNPNITTNNLLSGSTIVRAKGTGIIGPSGNTIDIDNYDPNGSGTLVPVTTNNFVAHRIWFQPTENVLVFQYGQYQYSNLSDARVNFPLESYVAPTVLTQETYLVAVVICRSGEVNLDNPARAQIIPQGKFAGTGGGGTTPDTLQSAYNNSTSPEITTDGTRGAVDFRAGSGLDSNNVITFQQNSGTINGFVTGTGNAKFNSLSGSSLTISTIPTLNNSGTQILVRNTSTGLVNYRDVSTITPDTNYYVSGGSYNTTTYNINFSGNTSETTFDVDLTNLYGTLSGDTYLIAGSYIDATDTLSLLRNDGQFVNITGITDNYITGGTLVGNTLVLNRTDLLSAVTVDFTQFLDNTNFYVTGGTLDSNSIVIGRNDTSNILTISGGSNVTVTEPISGTFKIDSSYVDTNDYITGGTLVGNTLVLDRTDVLSAVTVDFSQFLDNTNNYVTGFTYDGYNQHTVSLNNGSNYTTTISTIDTNLIDVVTVGENVVSGDLLYLSTDTKYYKADNTSESTSSTELRLALESISIDATGDVLIQGTYTTTGLTSGSTYWVGTGGSIITTQPTDNATIVRYVGTASDGETLEFNPDGLYIEISNQTQVDTPTNPAYRATTTSGSILADDWTVNVTTTSDTTQTLPTAVGRQGKVYNIKNSDSTKTSTVTIATTGGELIDGLYGNGIDFTIIFPQSITVQSTGSGWIII